MTNNQRDFSKYVGGQCEIHSNPKDNGTRRMLRGDIKSITVTDTTVEICFDWLASWSLRESHWMMVDPKPENLIVKFGVDNPSDMYAVGLQNDNVFMIDFLAQEQFLLLYPKDYTVNGRPFHLRKEKVEADQKRWKEACDYLAVIQFNSRPSNDV